MAKFRDSTLHAASVHRRHPCEASERRARCTTAPSAPSSARRATCRREQVEEILAHQREKGVRFGEAAIALGFASTDDVLFALAQQFHYPYAPEERRKISPELVALNQPFSRAGGVLPCHSQPDDDACVHGDRSRARALAVVSPEYWRRQDLTSPPTWR